MTDKELEEWEKEYEDASMDIKHIIKIVVIIGLIILIMKIYYFLRLYLIS